MNNYKIDKIIPIIFNADFNGSSKTITFKINSSIRMLIVTQYKYGEGITFKFSGGITADLPHLYVDSSYNTHHIDASNYIPNTSITLSSIWDKEYDSNIANISIVAISNW